MWVAKNELFPALRRSRTPTLWLKMTVEGSGFRVWDLSACGPRHNCKVSLETSVNLEFAGEILPGCWSCGVREVGGCTLLLEL